LLIAPLPEISSFVPSDSLILSVKDMRRVYSSSDWYSTLLAPSWILVFVIAALKIISDQYSQKIDLNKSFNYYMEPNINTS
jgi:hypothetical protein